MTDEKWGTIWYIESSKFTNEDEATLGRWHETGIAHNVSKHEVPFPVKPAYYQTSAGIDPEDVLIDWLTEHGVDKENAYSIAHSLVHSVLYSVGRAVQHAAVGKAKT